MGKKQYIAPKIIDLSIETITGVGAKDCTTGGSIRTSYCNHGYGATSLCSQGNAASAGCNSGDLPHQSGVYCHSGSGAGTFCDDGGSASRAYGKCFNGTSVTGVCMFVGASPVAVGDSCPSGIDEASYCSNGNTQVPHGSS
ncbi:MAG TPA: hypothetical protein VN372_01680 [Methanospirillum sp.]|nr:hypothetical protein [Methanospirillum sp.]